MTPEKIVGEIKCRRCKMLIADCPKTRWTTPLCVVEGVEWDQHVIGISDLTSHSQAIRERVDKVKYKPWNHALDMEGDEEVVRVDDILALLNDSEV